MRMNPSATRGRRCRFFGSIISNTPMPPMPRLCWNRSRVIILRRRTMWMSRWRALMQAAKRSAGTKLTRPLLLPDGTVLKDVSFEQAADSLRRYIEQGTDRALPDLGIPQGDDRTGKAFIRQPDPVAMHIESIVAPAKDFCAMIASSPGAAMQPFPFSPLGKTMRSSRRTCSKMHRSIVPGWAIIC